MQQKGSNILPVDPLLPDPRGGIKSSKFNFFLEHCISNFKGMTNAATWEHIFCPYTHPRPLGLAQSQNFFLKVVMLHIKSLGMEHRALCKHIFCL